MNLRGFLFSSFGVVFVSAITSAEGEGLPAPTYTEISATSQGDIENASEVKNGMLVYIINVDHRWAKLRWNPNWGDKDCNFDTGDYKSSQLWKLVEDEQLHGKYFLENFAASVETGGNPTHRYAFNPDVPPNSYCYDGHMDEDQLWYFTKISAGENAGFWLIYNYKHSLTDPTCRLAVWEDDGTDGGAWCGPVRRDQAFRLKPAFNSDAMWTLVDDFNNETSGTVPYVFKYTEGISQTIADTVAASEEAELSLAMSVEGAIKALGLTGAAEATVKASFSESYSRTRVKKWGTARTYSFDVPANTHFCLKQLKVTNVDNLNGESFIFSSKLTKLQEGSACGTNNL